MPRVVLLACAIPVISILVHGYAQTSSFALVRRADEAPHLSTSPADREASHALEFQDVPKIMPTGSSETGTSLGFSTLGDVPEAELELSSVQLHSDTYGERGRQLALKAGGAFFLALSMAVFFLWCTSAKSISSQESEHQSPHIHQWNLNYRPEVDGLRALAVVPIILYHFQVACPGGFVGVDVFFVISGYLITRILLSDIQNKKPIWQFWMRRVRRLLPALAVVSSVVLIAGCLTFEVELLTSLAEQVCAVLFGAANFLFYHSTDYFFDSLGTPMLHCWSLAVEEQFYLLYPWLLYFICGSSSHSDPDQVLHFLLAAVLSMSLAACIFGTREDSSFAFYMLPTRAWEFVLGSMVLLDEKNPRFCNKAVAEVASSVGLAAILIACCTFRMPMLYPDYRALLPCLGTALFITSQRQQSTFCGRIFAHPCLTYVGKMSYSLYLWHWPIYALLCYRCVDLKLDTPYTALAMILTMAASLLTYLFVEQLFRSEARMPLERFLPMSVGAWIAILFAAVLLSQVPLHTSETESILTTSIMESGVCNTSAREYTTSFLRFDASDKQLQKACIQTPSAMQINAFYNVPENEIRLANVRASIMRIHSKSYEAESHPFGARFAGYPQKPGESPKVVMIGSSFCNMFGDLLHRLGLHYNVSVATYCRSGVPGNFSNPLTEWDLVRLSHMQQWQPEVVFWVDPWQNAKFSYGLTVDVVSRNFKLLLEVAKKVVVLGAPPSLSIPGSYSTKGSELYKQMILTRGKADGNFSFLAHNLEPNSEHERRKSIESNFRLAASIPEFQGRAQFFPVDQYYVNEVTKHVMPIDPCKGTLIYFNPRHLNLDGTSRVELLLRKEIFGQLVCA